jgi:hypothetical protein
MADAFDAVRRYASVTKSMLDALPKELAETLDWQRYYHQMVIRSIWMSHYAPRIDRLSVIQQSHLFNMFEHHMSWGIHFELPDWVEAEQAALVLLDLSWNK